MTGESKQIYTFVKNKIQRLAQGGGTSASKAALASLRRGIGKAPGSMPELWDVTLGEMPEKLLSKKGEPTRGEWAVHTALTLYALHQQGNDPKSKCMSKEKESLGKAVKKLADKRNEEAVLRRFHTAATAESFEEFSWHMRGLVQLLKAEAQPLDYPALAQDMYWFQFPERRDGIRLQWGQDYYSSHRKDNQETEAK